MPTQPHDPAPSLTPFQDAAEQYGTRAAAAADRALQQQDEREPLTIHPADGVYWALLQRTKGHRPAGTLLHSAFEALDSAAQADEASWRELDDWRRESEPFDQTYFLDASADVEAQARAIVALFDAVRRPAAQEDK